MPRQKKNATENSELNAAQPSSGLLKKKDAAEFVGVSTRSFERHVLPYVARVRVGGLYLYPLDELRAWLDRNTVAPARRDRVEATRDRVRSSVSPRARDYLRRIRAAREDS
mgnify:CR=1 FL=1